MNSKTIIFWITLGVLQTPLAFSETIEVNFDSLRTLLENRNLKLEAHRLETEAAQTREGHFARSFFPSLDLYAGQETFKKGPLPQMTQPTYGLEAKVNLYNGGIDKLESEIRELNTQKKSVQYQRFTADELLEARVLFWQILYSQEKVGLLESVIKINSQNTESALKRIRSGVATESDKMEFEIKATDLKQDMELAQLELKTQIDELKVLLNTKPPDTLNLPKIIGHEHEFEDKIKHTHADHELQAKENDLQAELNTLTSKKQKRVWLPKVDAIAGYNQFNQRDEEDYPDKANRTESFVGLRISMSIPEGLDSIKESEAQAKEAEAQRKLAEQQRIKSHAHVETEVAELKLLHSQVHDAEENITRAEKYYKLTQQEYARGVKNSPDMLSASEKIYAVKNKRLEILKEFNLKQAHVLAKINR